MNSSTVKFTQEEIYRLVADTTSHWEEWIGRDGNYVYISPACEDITGYPPEDFINDRELRCKIVHDADFSLYQSHCQQSENALQEDCELEYRITHRDGATRLRQVNPVV